MLIHWGLTLRSYCQTSLGLLDSRKNQSLAKFLNLTGYHRNTHTQRIDMEIVRENRNRLS